MNDQFESKITKLYVGKLRNSPAITCVSRLDLDHFESQLNSPRFNQRLPQKKLEKVVANMFKRR
jgi:hypothetical protein